MNPLDPASFVDDVEVRVGHGESDAFVSERLFRRLVLIGQAYGLHRLGLLDSDAELSPLQADGLLHELLFVRALVPQDEALMSVIVEMTPLVERSARSTADPLLIEWN